MNYSKKPLRSVLLGAILMATASYACADTLQNGTTTLQSMAVSTPPTGNTSSSVADKNAKPATAQVPVKPAALTTGATSKAATPSAAPKSTAPNAAESMPQPPSQAETILTELRGMPAVSIHAARESTFQNSARQKGLAMSPSEIEQYHEMILDSAVAAAKLPMPKASAPIVRVSLAPGQVPPVLYVSSNYVTAVTFTDKTGAPWPILNHVLGNALFFSATVPTSNKENVILITPLKQGVSSNVAITLQGLTQPIIIPVKASLKRVDYRENIMVDGLGPYAEKPIFVEGPSSEVGGKNLTSVLDGIQPAGSTQVTATGLPNMLAYEVNGMLYIRAKASLVEPSWVASMSGDGGYTAWKLPFSSPLTFMYNGSRVSVDVSRKSN